MNKPLSLNTYHKKDFNNWFGYITDKIMLDSIPNPVVRMRFGNGYDNSPDLFLVQCCSQ
ncbi:hypothetical protein [Filimonas effusa]|uniref:hypothetical protein n=1 Tax=Filimonas effusa TaxID=2508721 RepID=UPI0013E97EE1|nr:hypothetical protein [Filimonas effusa]